jgi:hypothetical protein
MRLFMKPRSADPIPVAAARAGFSAATGYRMAQDPRPALGGAPREHRTDSFAFVGLKAHRTFR